MFQVRTLPPKLSVKSVSAECGAAGRDRSHGSVTAVLRSGRSWPPGCRGATTMSPPAHPAPEEQHVSPDQAESRRPRTLIVLAAGEGKRMKSALPKVLHPLLGATILARRLAAAHEGLGDSGLLVVVGHGADRVREHLSEIAPAATPVLQA